ncbi:MAG: hypothetical protein ACP5PX_00835 [Candidatus Hadarchaeum sp.]|uniref:hypothetical protein n=1 Tax=Candidatus Hadarchaeum sp. TaxID=2883567 RepID=UPI003D11C4FF
MSKIKVFEGGHLVQELTIEEALELIKQRFFEGQSVIIDGVYVDASDIEKVKEKLSKAKEGISFFPLIGGGKF